MNLQKYTEKAQEAVLNARQLAEDSNHNQIEPIHLLSALAEQPEGVVPQLLTRMGVDVGALMARVNAELERVPKVYGGSQSYLSGALNEVGKRAESKASSMKDEYVST